MFGGPLDPPQKPKPRPRPDPEFQDVLNPSVHPGYYVHHGPEPNTNYQTRLLHYKQRNSAIENEAMALESKRITDEYYKMKFKKHTDRKRSYLEIKSRVSQKLQEYEEELDKKRERLRVLLAEDERLYYAETVDNLQKGKDRKYEQAKERLKQIEAEKEAKRLKIVEEKRIQQYANRCHELRPVMTKRHLIESKVVQLQQMRENEARRASQKEWDKFWEDVMHKDIEAKMEREQQESLNEYRIKQENKGIIEQQIRGKELAKIEAERIVLEDRLEMDKLTEQLRREEIEVLKKKQKAKHELAGELMQQMRFQEKILADRELEEKRLNEAFTYLSQLEYEREKAKLKDTTTAARLEMMQYRDHLIELERERLEGERKLDELLNEYRLSIEKQQDEARCKVLEAKQKLLQDTLDGRAEQIAYKRLEAEQQLKLKQAENEICRLNYETNVRLGEEDARRRAVAAQEYRNDLCKQIDYHNTLLERERLELERQLELGRQEEEKYKKKVEDIMATDFYIGGKHPFRRVLEKHDCHCPKLEPKY